MSGPAPNHPPNHAPGHSPGRARDPGGGAGRAGPRGFVLVNALVLVAACAAAAVFVLGRAEAARQRQAALQGAEQARLYLDGVEALALARLQADQQGGAIDTLAEPWARPGAGLEIDRGTAALTLTDLQGRFNVNWLANPADAAARAGFARLLGALNLPPRLGPAIIGFLRPGGPADRRAYAGQDPAIAPPGGPVMALDQLAVIPALSPAHLERLRPYLAALPGDRPLNVNTAPALVLWALLPGARRAALDQLLAQRARRPFISVADFETRIAAVLGDAGLAEEETLRYAIGSDWFAADIEVALDGLILRRQTVIERQPLPHGPRVAYRLEGRP